MSKLPAPLLTGPRAGGCHQGIVCRHGVPWYHLPLQEQLVITAAHGGEVRWLLAALRGLQAAELGHQTGHVSTTPHEGPLGPAGWQDGLQQAGSSQGVLPGPGGPAGHPQDGSHYPLWAVRVSEDAWAQECQQSFQRFMDEVWRGWTASLST